MINDPFQMQRELRYGAPVCDQILTGRYFTIGYSWYFRQAKWTLEIINRERQLFPDLEKAERLNNFRADLRIPGRFRASLEDFKGSGFDRGHLVPAANQNFGPLVNSETFLLSNMSPQAEEFNRKKWAELEDAVRQLDAQDGIFETYVLTCPIFYYDREIKTIGKAKGVDGVFGNNIPVPHAFIKSVLAEDKRGQLSLWTFEMENKELDPKKPLSDYLVSTYDAEELVGGRFWDRVSGGDLHTQKKTLQKMWAYKPKKTRASKPAKPAKPIM
jgi:endonuclease G, mitochondrial